MSDVSAYAELCKHLELDAVQLVGVSLNISMPGDVVEAERLNLKVTHNYHWQYDPDMLSEDRSEVFCFISTNISASFAPGTEDYNLLVDGVALSGGCMFVVRFGIPGNINLDQESLAYITKEFAPIHLGPVLKHYFESQFLAMGLQGLSFPLLT